MRMIKLRESPDGPSVREPPSSSVRSKKVLGDARPSAAQRPTTNAHARYDDYGDGNGPGLDHDRQLRRLG